MRPFLHALAVIACCFGFVSVRSATAGTLVRFSTNLGSFDVDLFSDPSVATTVGNFLAYANSGRYTNTIFHRSTTYNPASIQIIQGGSYVLAGSTLNPIVTDPPIPLQGGFANVRGTIAMARTNDPNSATSGWFFNVTSNPALDYNYAVFGAVVDTPSNPGLAVIDAIAAVQVYDASAQLGAAFSELPLLQTNSLVVVSGVAPVPEPSTLMLACLGIAGAIAAGRRPVRRRASGRAP